jgi:hypothetical protein
MAQIEDVVNIDKLDTIDRQKLDPRVKLQLLCTEAKLLHGRDPRSRVSGLSFVGRPRVVLQLFLDFIKFGCFADIKLERPVIVGRGGADLVGWWCDVAIVVRSTTRDDRLWIVPDANIPESQMVDRRQAAALRMHAHAGSLEGLRDE